MHMRAFDYLRVIAEIGSLRGAAQKIGITATALSRQIEHLEYYFRVKLLERDQRGIRLTPAGNIVVETAEKVLHELDNTQKRVDDLKGLRSGLVNIRVSSSTLTTMVAPALLSLNDEYPGLRFLVEVSSAPLVGEALVAGKADLGLTIFAPDLSELTLCKRLPVVHCAIMAPSHPLSNNTMISLHDLPHHTLSIPDSAYFVRRAFDRAVKSNGISLDPVFITGAFELQIELALCGRAILFLPEFSCHNYIMNGQLCAVSLAHDLQVPTSLDLLKASHKPLSTAARIVSTRIGEIMTKMGSNQIASTRALSL